MMIWRALCPIVASLLKPKSPSHSLSFSTILDGGSDVGTILWNLLFVCHSEWLRLGDAFIVLYITLHFVTFHREQNSSNDTASPPLDFELRPLLPANGLVLRKKIIPPRHFIWGRIEFTIYRILIFSHSDPEIALWQWLCECVPPAITWMKK